jgi:hypothetical protein
MDEEVENFRTGLLSEIRAEALASGDYERARFVDRACETLLNAEEIPEYTLCQADKAWKHHGRVQIDAYCLSEADGIATLIVADFSGTEAPDALTTDDVRDHMAAAERFLKGSIHSDVAECWDESHPAHSFSRALLAFNREDMTKARLVLVSDRERGQRVVTMPELSIGTLKIDLQIWDVARLCRAETSTLGREQILVDLEAEYERPLFALPVDAGDTDYRSYMCVMPGEILASLYDRFGGRILEQNVRAFLGDGRKVNRGIRETLRDRPEMLFAYNNGITATASSVAINASGSQPRITSITDFQVVNGGQTTASLYWARRANLDLSKAFVQMKLSVLKEEGFEESVHNIARYANAQTPVSASDLFAGSPFFKRLEGLSRQTLAPAVGVGGIETYWYFERTQGAYNVELKRRNGYAAKTWELLHPKRQRLTKTDIARYEATWSGLPYSVCAGQQKNIAAFGKLIEAGWKKSPEQFDAEYFKEAVAKAILVKTVDATIPGQSWYPRLSILRQISTYSVALVAERLRTKNLDPNFDAIWTAQRVPKPFTPRSCVQRSFRFDISPKFRKNRCETG